MALTFSEEERKQLIPLVQKYFQTERGEDMGLLAAELFLDFLARDIGPVIYNKALFDAQRAVRDNQEELAYRLYELEQPIAKQ